MKTTPIRLFASPRISPVLLSILLLSSALVAGAQTATSTLAVNCGSSQGSFFYLSSRINVPFYYGCSFDSQSRLRDDLSFLAANSLATNMVRVFMSPETIKFSSSGINNYDTYIDNVSTAAPNLMVAVSPPGNTITTLAEYQGYVHDILDHLKTRYPTKTFYIEAVNEPDLAGMSDATYYSYYKMFVAEVNTANSAHSTTPAMKVGGPVFGKWNPTRLQAFITNYGADHATSGLRLDFLSYHEYASFQAGADVSPDNLVQLQFRRVDLEALIATNNAVSGNNVIPLSTPCYVTEAGIYAGGNFDCGGYPITDAILMQAASIATMNYYYVVNGNLRMTPLVWCSRLDQHQVKSMFVPQSDQVLTPFGHLVKFLGRLDSTRVAVTMTPDPTDSAQTTTGFGVYALPTTKSNQVAVLVWNWRHDDTSSPSTDITLSFSNLPSGFTGHTVKMTRYLVDATHSNYLNSFASAGVATVATINNFNVGNYQFNLLNNAVSLILLDPM